VKPDQFKKNPDGKIAQGTDNISPTLSKTPRLWFIDPIALVMLFRANEATRRQIEAKKIAAQLGSPALPSAKKIRTIAVINH
jgi:hypothetical protein